jgi:predicted DNA-binding transcriptional regulator AlpA
MRDCAVQGALRRLRKPAQYSTNASMSVVRTNAAAALLGVSPNTLRSWERRFGFPQPRRTQGGHRQFELAEIEALRQAFAETHNVGSAGRSPELGFAWRYATGWLAANQRVAPPAHRADGVLIFDASGPLDLDALHIQAFELMLRRAGVRTLALSVDLDSDRISRAVRALHPTAVVLSGRRASLDVLGRLVFAARRHAAGVEILDFRAALPDTGASTVVRLGNAPMAARDALIDHLAGHSSATVEEELEALLRTS